jgi:pimeloyl-ACP methyl ester carboxylesterase
MMASPDTHMNRSAASLLDHPVLSGRFFYPCPTRFEAPFYVEGRGYRLGCRYRRVDAAAPTIVHFHVNGETVADYLGGCEERIVSMGVNVLLVEYRGYGMSTGEPALAAMLADVELVIRAAAVAPERIVFFGRSLGSLYAVHGAGLYPGAAGLILESAIADPLERILLRVEPWQLGTDGSGLAAAVAAKLDQRAKLASFHGRTLVMHAQADDLVHVSHAERLHRWANEPKDLILFPRGDHNTVMVANEVSYFAAVERFLGLL